MLYASNVRIGWKKALGSFVLAGFVLASVWVNIPANFARADDIQHTEVSLVPDTGTLTVGQTLEVRIKQLSQMDSLTLDPAGTCTVNGKTMTALEHTGSGNYRLVYTVAAGDANVAAGQLAFSCDLAIPERQQSNTLSAFTEGNSLAINATSTGDDNNDDDNNDDNNNNDTNTNASSTADGTIDGNVQGGSTQEDNGVLAVTSIDQVRTVATADGSIENGWKWVFNVTVPSNETSLSMKFDNWLHTNNVNSISPANNMRISSPQAGNSNVMITGANIYTSPIAVTGDLNSSMPGKQIQVTVEMGVPVGSANGSYSTSYFVKTQQI